MNKKSCKADLFERMDVAGVGRLIMVVIGKENSPTHLVQVAVLAMAQRGGNF